MRAWEAGGITEWMLRMDFVNRYNNLARRPEYPELYYARVVKNTAGDRYALQYWIPYYFNNFSNYHEADWEMIQVDLSDDLEPIGAAFSQHTGAKKRWWGNMEVRDTHPVVYVGKGSHANYFAADEYNVQVPNYPDAKDYAEAHEPIHEPLVEVLPDVSSNNLGNLLGGPYSWLAYQGAWGEILGIPWLDAPQGPAAAPEHSTTWDDSFSWYEGLPFDGEPLGPGESYNGTYGSIASPAEIHLYDAAGNHVGKNDTGDIDRQIPGAEYLEIPELHRKTIIVHGGDASDGYRFVLEGTGDGTFDFTVGSPNRMSNSSDTADYIGVPVSSTTRVELGLGLNADYSLQIDSEGDGLVDEQRAPDSVIGHDIDLNPPASVSDLNVTEVSSGSVTLSFSAPGDDENTGTSQEYDVRYSKSLITEENWKEAEPLETVPQPQSARSTETVTATSLEADTIYYFALKSKDESLHTSALSNVAQATTKVPSLSWAKQRVYWASWTDYTNRHLSIDYRMTNIGSGTAFSAAVQASICNPNTVYVVPQLPIVL